MRNSFKGVRALVPGRIGNWKCYMVFVEGGKPEHPEKKLLGTGTRTNNKLNPHMAPIIAIFQVLGYVKNMYQMRILSPLNSSLKTAPSPALHPDH